MTRRTGLQRATLWLAATCWVWLAAVSASAATLDRVRQQNTLRCGAAERAGFAETGEDGRITGLAVDLCRAVTIAVLGPGGQTAFRLYSTDRDYQGIAQGVDDLAFLPDAAVAQHHLAAALIPGPVAFVVGLTALAHPGVDALPGRTVCFMNGSPAHQAVEAWASRTGATIIRGGYQEDGELQDAYDAGRCDAIAGEASELAQIRASARGRADSHLFAPLAVLPVRAFTSIDDGAWASLVGWSLSALVQLERKPSPWRDDPVGISVPGLRPGWLAQVSASLGDYADMVRRHALVGLNAPWPDGVLLPPGPR